MSRSDFLTKCPEAAGNCFQAAIIMAELFAGERSLRVCHGAVTQTKPPFIRMGHAWIEVKRDGVWYCVDGQRPANPIPRTRYYEIGKIAAAGVVRYRAYEARETALATGNFGPWDKTLLESGLAYANEPEEKPEPAEPIEHACVHCRREYGEDRLDARGIYLTRACDRCWPEIAKRYRSDVLENPNYESDEPIDED